MNDLGLAQNTIVVFASDNGGFIDVDRKSGQTVPVTNNAPLRSGKGSCYEGGIRVPWIIRWPGVAARDVQCDEPVVVMDLFPTLLHAAGVALAADKEIDGVDLLSLLKNPNQKLERDALFFHYPHYYSTTTPVSAIRAGDWKLLEYFEDNHVELYNLQQDLGETTDLAEQKPKQASQLRERLHAWRDEVNAALPSPNPNFQSAMKSPAQEDGTSPQPPDPQIRPTARADRDLRGVTAYRDLAYVTNGHARQKLDLYVPQQADGPLPLILWVHGGGWAAGSKDGCPPLHGGYTQRGYAVASIGYRLSGDAVFPAQIEDCKAAIRWLRAMRRTTTSIRTSSPPGAVRRVDISWRCWAPAVMCKNSTWASFSDNLAACRRSAITTGRPTCCRWTRMRCPERV